MLPSRIATALLALGCCHAASAAVELSPDGRGQVLFYPFYTVENDNATLFNVVNATDRAKALRLAVREARNSRTVSYLHLYLGPHATWTAGIVDDPAGGGARLVPSTRACTVPASVDAAGGIIPLPFRSDAYTGARQDYPQGMADQLGGIERTRTGYIEIIEMGELQAGAGPMQLGDEFEAPAYDAARCDAVLQAWMGGGAWAADPTVGIDLPGGGLYGTAALVDVADGAMYGYDAVALSGFYTDTAAPAGLHRSPDPFEPSIEDAASGNDEVVARLRLADGSLAEEVFPPSRAGQAVAFALMRASLITDFSVGAALEAQTEYVIAFPTRGQQGVSGESPFPVGHAQTFAQEGRILTPVTHRGYARDGEQRVLSGGCDVSVCGLVPPDFDDPRSLDHSVNVVAPGQSADAERTAILGAAVDEVRVIATELDQEAFAEVDAGHLDVDLYRARHSLLAPSGAEYRGLPAIGVSFQRFLNSNAEPGRVGTYGDARAMRSTPASVSTPAR